MTTTTHMNPAQALFTGGLSESSSVYLEHLADRATGEGLPGGLCLALRRQAVALRLQVVVQLEEEA